MIYLTERFKVKKKSGKDFLTAGCLLILSDKDYRQKNLCEFYKFVFTLNFPTAVLKTIQYLYQLSEFFWRFKQLCFNKMGIINTSVLNEVKIGFVLNFSLLNCFKFFESFIFLCSEFCRFWFYLFLQHFDRNSFKELTNYWQASIFCRMFLKI